MRDSAHHRELGGEARQLLDDLFDKWSLLVLDRLCAGPLRFSELRRELPSVTPKSLTATLRRLEGNGLVVRDVESTRPVTVRYSVSSAGRSLEQPLGQILDWVEHRTAAR